jgi:hypothetical protein
MRRLQAPLIAIAWGILSGIYIFDGPLKEHFGKPKERPESLPKERES